MNDTIITDPDRLLNKLDEQVRSSEYFLKGPAGKRRRSRSSLERSPYAESVRPGTAGTRRPRKQDGSSPLLGRVPSNVRRSRLAFRTFDDQSKQADGATQAAGNYARGILLKSRTQAFLRDNAELDGENEENEIDGLRKSVTFDLSPPCGDSRLRSSGSLSGLSLGVARRPR